MRTVDLFCGCGGLSLGFQKAGFNIRAAFDNWDEAITVYHNNFHHPVHKLDLSNVDEAVPVIQALRPEMIIGGPPCQDFSSAGLRDEDNGRGDLTISYAQIIAAVRPEWFVMENVDRIIKTQKLVEAIEIFREAGYGLTRTILNASRCGAPQRRKRFFMIGHLGAEDDFMLNILTERQSEKEMTVRDYFGDQLDIQYYYRHPRSYVRRGIFSVDEPSPTIRGVNRPMPDGYQIHANDPVQVRDGIRPLTTLERSMIQTFPRNYRFLGSRTDMEQMIGNAVPVNLAKYVGDCIMAYLGVQRQVNLEDIKESFPEAIVTHDDETVNHELNLKSHKHVLISFVKNDSVDMFLDGSARIYYTGKKFPSTVALNKLYYFMPYVKGRGVKDIYLIKIARVGSKHEVHPDADENDFRLVFEIEKVGQLFEKYKMVPLQIWRTFTDTTIKELLKK